MQITKNKNGLIITLDSGVTISGQSLIDAKKGIVFDFKKDHPIVTPEVLEINNPGEYEYNEILVKVSPEINILVSTEDLKIALITSNTNLDKDKNLALAEIIVIDNLIKSDYLAEDIINIVKTLDPKVVVVNGDIVKGDLTNFEKVNKLKLKRSDLTSIPDNKGYII